MGPLLCFYCLLRSVEASTTEIPNFGVQYRNIRLSLPGLSYCVLYCSTIEGGIRPIRRRGRADHVGAGRGAVSLAQRSARKVRSRKTTHSEATRIKSRFRLLQLQLQSAVESSKSCGRLWDASQCAAYALLLNCSRPIIYKT